MAILHSWCCWRSVRKGSFACGFYTAFYFTITAAHASIILHEELKLGNCTAKGNCTEIRQASILDPDLTSDSSATFTLVSLSVSSSGVFTSCLLLYGLYRDCKILLIPWILNLLLFILHDLGYIFYSFIENALKFNPSIGILITVDFFITSLNVYALLCVISQYQELKAGRGRALDDRNNRSSQLGEEFSMVPNVHYSQATATSYLSRRAVTNHETRPTPTHSPTGNGPQSSFDEERSPSIFTKTPRKSVKFPDRPATNEAQLLEPWTIDVKSPKGADTAPLIETNTVLQSNL